MLKFILFYLLIANISLEKKIQVGAEQIDTYLPLLKGKKVGLVVNHTSVVGEQHLADTLISLKVEVVKVFAPEHGFRGNADAGETVENAKDKRTGLPIISLYGKNKKPSASQIEDLDVLIFDIQDVGTRFYTYISTMHYVMQACAEQNKTLIVLDRPNPNGDYIDGPVLEPAFRSFVGMHPIPVVHGLSVGELAQMINGEGWLNTEPERCKLHIVKVKNYRHSAGYNLPIKPSPNLPNQQSVRLYPSLCFFEGTQMSIGRGTYFPFQVIGAPFRRLGRFSFRPQSIVGMSKSPKYQDEKCYGIDLRQAHVAPRLDLSYLIRFYRKYPHKKKFFKEYFNTLAGTAKLQEQIRNGWSEAQIRQSWQKDLKKYQKLREKYRLYAN